MSARKKGVYPVKDICRYCPYYNSTYKFCLRYDKKVSDAIAICDKIV